MKRVFIVIKIQRSKNVVSWSRTCLFLNAFKAVWDESEYRIDICRSCISRREGSTFELLCNFLYYKININFMCSLFLKICKYQIGWFFSKHLHLLTEILYSVINRETVCFDLFLHIQYIIYQILWTIFIMHKCCYSFDLILSRSFLRSIFPLGFLGISSTNSIPPLNFF